MLNKNSDENIEIKKIWKNNKRIEYIYIIILQHIFFQLWDAVVVELRWWGETTRPTDTHNILINGTAWETGSILKVIVPGVSRQRFS